MFLMVSNAVSDRQASVISERNLLEDESMSNMLDQSKSLVNNKISYKENHDNSRAKRTEIGPWDVAIAEAEQRIADFKFSIKVFKRMKEKGVPWCGIESVKAGTEAESIPA